MQTAFNPAGDAGLRQEFQTNALLTPVDVIEDAAGITVYADLPGVAKDTLNVRVEGDQLCIDAQVQLPFAKGVQLTHAELDCPRFYRAFTLSRELDADRVSAELVNGVLKLRIPKADHAQPRKVSVQIA
jgi:HSP20 family protein